LEYAQNVVKAAGLEDKIKFQLVDYRNVQGYHKFNRIISCEMLEHVGHDYHADWFRCCDDLLTKDGLVVVQLSSKPEERYDAYRQSSEFIKEYIFPGVCVPSFAALTAAMGSGSSFCVEHMENIGRHYCETLLRWQDQFQRNRNEILKLGFGEKFIRTWDYYFFYCAAGFKSCTLGVLQIVFSRPGNEAVLGSPSMSFPTA
jgi:cyclopropane-fatty-acyl-phospholipid synthase